MNLKIIFILIQVRLLLSISKLHLKFVDSHSDSKVFLFFIQVQGFDVIYVLDIVSVPVVVFG